MKNILLFFFSLVVTANYAQVIGLNYLLNHNCETNLYEVKIKILEGSATNTGDRVQFNSQISMVIPTGLSFEIIERQNPIENNQNYNGTVPCDWSTFTPVISPPEQPENDFYSISPQLSPASFYNNINTGDEIILFICKIGTDTEYNPDIRFYDNNEDPPIQSAGSDFKNGFAIGSPKQIYQTNEYESCINNTSEIDSRLKIYPNPFRDKLFVESLSEIDNITLTGMNGKQVINISNIGNRETIIDTNILTKGIYVLQYQAGQVIESIKVIKL